MNYVEGITKLYEEQEGFCKGRGSAVVKLYLKTKKVNVVCMDIVDLYDEIMK